MGVLLCWRVYPNPKRNLAFFFWENIYGVHVFSDVLNFISDFDQIV